MELVSIVVCTYNGERFIGEQLQSILDQSYSNLEIIVGDDASQDNTVTIVKEYSDKHHNIRLLAYKDNLGYIKNFERTISRASGNYIALSDQDDFWMPRKIESLMKIIGSRDLAYCNSSFVDEKLQDMGIVFSQKKNMISSNNAIHLMLDNCVSGHAALFKKSLYNSAIPFPNHIPHDWWLAYNAALQNGLTYLDKTLVKYRHHGSNVIVSKNRLRKTKKQKRLEKRNRIASFYKKCPDNLTLQKRVSFQLKQSYTNFLVLNNFKRSWVVFLFRKDLLKISRKSDFKKGILIFNLFFKLK